MNTLETAIVNALAHQNDNKAANKAYLEFIKANFLVPIEKHSQSEEPEVLYLEENGLVFLPVFTNRALFDQWAMPISENIQILSLSGVNLLKGLADSVIVSLNIGSEFYKEFNASELMRMKNMVLKLFE